jgi:hypothetical protein
LETKIEEKDILSLQKLKQSLCIKTKSKINYFISIRHIVSVTEDAKSISISLSNSDVYKINLTKSNSKLIDTITNEISIFENNQICEYVYS